MADQKESSVPEDVALPKFDNLRFSRALQIRNSIFDASLSDTEKAGVVDNLNQNNDIFLQALSRPKNYQQALSLLTGLFNSNDKDPAIENYGYSFVERNLSALETIVVLSQDNTHKEALLGFISRLSGSGKEDRKELLVPSLQRILAKEVLTAPYSEERRGIQEGSYGYLWLFRRIFSLGTDEQIRETTRFLVSSWDKAVTPELKQHTGHIIANMIGTYGDLATQASRGLAEHVLEDYGLDYSELSRRWGNYSLRTGVLQMTGINIRKIIDLESARPNLNIAKILNEEFGISLFQRYPNEVLLEQFDHKDDPEVPYGLMVPALDDHNEALGSVGMEWFLQNLHDGLSRVGYTLRIYEAGSEDKLKEAFEKANRRYGIKSPSFGLIAGHGTPESIEMNWENPRYPNRIIRKQSFQGEPIWKFSDFMQERGSLFLISCSTGAENGIAQEISRQGITVAGPDQEAGVGNLYIDKNPDGALNFRISYRGARTNTYKNGILQTV